MFFHFLSFSFIFFVFVGGSKSDFLGLNFAAISLYISFSTPKKNLPVSGGRYPFEASFPVFFLPFFPPFSSSWILFFFSFFFPFKKMFFLICFF